MIKEIQIHIDLDDLKTGTREEVAAVLRQVADKIDSQEGWGYCPRAVFEGRHRLASLKVIENGQLGEKRW